ncbi:MAG: ABC transporter permease subunit [Xanthomonadaceae bacterium]|nr:ABC transporter permease subunit [Xanthomonadaceae bacterium]
MIGFEVDIMTAIGKKIDHPMMHVQNGWDNLIPGLQRGDYDLAINGIEITDDRREQVLFTVPYYLTYEQLAVRADNEDVEDISDLKGKPVGTLKASVAERILNAEKNIIVKGYDHESSAFEDLANGRLEAVLLDAPLAIYYAKPNPKLKLVGPPISQLQYGIGVKKTNGELVSAINKAIKSMIQSGELREILEKWNLWNPMMTEYTRDNTPNRTNPSNYNEYLKTAGFSERTAKQILKQWLSYFPKFLLGAWITLQISILSMILAVVMGLGLSILRLYGPTPVSLLTTAYIEVVRGTPLLIQLFFIFYALPHIGIKLSPFIAAVIGLGFNYAAYEAENYRAGILSVPRGQMEAARALGMTEAQALRHVILPQALRLVIPPVTNDFISLLKDSSLVSIITLVELTKVYGQLSSTYFDYIGTGLMVAGFYLVMGLPFVRLAQWAESRYNPEKRSLKMIVGN